MIMNEHGRVLEDVVVEVIEDSFLPSSSYGAGVAYRGLVPAGTYKVSDPVGGRGSRIRSKTTTLIPANQPHSFGYDGTFYSVENGYLVSHFKKENENDI